MIIKKASLILCGSIIYFFAEAALASCPVFDSSGHQVTKLGDPLFEILSAHDKCPINVMEFRDLLKSKGGVLSSSMVANRSFHNPALGSFSFFEAAEMEASADDSISIKKSELFFGHFTTPLSDTLLGLDQDPESTSLMIELLAWDRQTEVYNFYELIGGAQGPTWFYRGNSADIWADTDKLHRQRPAAEPVFGRRLRCSGCHIAGGPIMKELASPHDSWWSQDRPLPLGGRLPDAEMKAIMDHLSSPQQLADSVALGLTKLMQGKAFKQKQAASPQIALRPLFCSEEVNLRTAPKPLDGPETHLLVPPGFFLDERLGAQAITQAEKSNYLAALQRVRSRFPETGRRDGDYPWNAPVKAASDQMAVAQLIPQRIDMEFVADVLAVDMTKPVFSKKRCELLPLLPTRWSSNWQKEFQESLQKSPLLSAQELLRNFKDQEKTAAYHKKRAQNFLEQCQVRLHAADGVLSLVHYLGQTRAEISASEISKNPRGQILEPGFRVIFPVFNPSPVAWTLSLDDGC